MRITTWLGIGFSLILASCAPLQKENELRTWIDHHVAEIEPLMKAANLAYWNAAVTGDQAYFTDYAAHHLDLKKIYSNREDFERLKQAASNRIKDPLLARQTDVLLNAYLENQIDPDLLEKMVSLQSRIGQTFSTFRGMMDGKRVSGNTIETLLKAEKDEIRRRKAWEAGKQVGPAVASDILELVRLRNQAARSLGFDNYHTMALTVSGQNPETIDTLFAVLAGMTREPFKSVKYELDDILSDQYDRPPESLAPWHYHDPFFQETPLVFKLDLDVYYRDRDIRQIAVDFFRGIGLDVREILERSDLYEKEGKNPHAFSIDIDREGDIRILCNLENNERWMETLLHELGHAVYDAHIGTDVPFLLRDPAHAFTTEAVAMLFGRLSRDPGWMAAMLGLDDSERTRIADVATKYARLKQLIFARWSMVMYRFEKALYTNPDQDLNALWWRLVWEYQMVKQPAGRNQPDWATKIHIALYPCYYHNYLLGELLASQLHHTLAGLDGQQNVHPTVNYVDNPEIGRFLRDRIFAPGKRYAWNEMIRRATGEPLTPRYYVAQFVE
ncbi:MAG TPA: peptidase M3 [bacterium]|nr:peptidase M3 [bacterium]